MKHNNKWLIGAIATLVVSGIGVMALRRTQNAYTRCR